jgi:hypothetical protein
MGAWKRRGLAAMIAAAVALPPAPHDTGRAAALEVPCVADCNGDGAVLINELIAAVNIALGSPLAGCPEADPNGDLRVSIDELVTAVSDALYGCGVEPPTPQPTRTATTTPSPSATPSTSPTPTFGIDVSGLWRSDMARVVSSACPKGITDSLRSAIRDGNFNCDFAVTQRGAVADVVETCEGESLRFVADISPAGVLSRSEHESDSVDGCPFTLTTTAAADLARSPSSISGTYDFAFGPACGVADCRAMITARIRRIEQ